MPTLRIRTFTVLCFFFILSLPWIFYVTAHFIETKTFRFSTPDENLQRHVTETIHTIETNADNWTDANWQRQLETQLRKANLEVAILSAASNQEMYRSNPESSSWFSSTERFSLIEDGQLLGKVVIYVPSSRMVPTISAIVGFLLAFIIVGIALRRFFLQPLERMGLVARKIAAGEFDGQLPIGRITEIADVSAGFEVMMKGLRTSQHKQMALEEERRFMIAAIAHDLRTPLFALRGYLDGLEQGIAKSPDKITKYVAVCKEKSRQLDRLVEDLFTFTTMEYMEQQKNVRPIDLKDLFQQTIDGFRPLAQQKLISISTDFEENCMIRGDSHLLERALNNLFDNAIRHTPSSGNIVVRCYKEDANVTFSLKDTGPGFSSEELERVFEPLFRGEVSRNRSTGGSGLGLTISQRIIKQHGGELAAKNHLDGGALINGWLPGDN
ncbi:sensor histidine kinase [Shouchella clausii]|uniref:sensor histidine kinase n=1 Tax=Shouchella clausii TaxID=79880 RepID=UPI000BA63524|nr:HAMP domain-containing sensor histidine kinase [Shouchella clausii]PAD16180.1 two-component sensor histidine kinase [Shouchella clausii]